MQPRVSSQPDFIIKYVVTNTEHYNTLNKHKLSVSITSTKNRGTYKWCKTQCALAKTMGSDILVTDLPNIVWNNQNSSNSMFSLQLHFRLFVPFLHLSVCQNELKCTDGCKLRCTDLVSNSLKHNLHFKWLGSSFSLQFHRCSKLIGVKETV